MAKNNEYWLLVPIILRMFASHFVTYCIASDADALLKFKSSLSNSNALFNWNGSTNPCDGWIGLRCNGDGTIGKLVLTNMALSGNIDVDSLMEIPTLRTISLTNNSFQGSLPQVKKLTSLRNLDLSFNNFSGEIPDDGFSGVNSLAQLYLGHNQFTGRIPGSLVGLTKLVKLSLEENQFTGSIPGFQQKFALFNVANNDLHGPIPSSLASVDPSAFTGNSGLCGKPLTPCKETSKKKVIIIICVIAVSVVALVAILGCTLIYWRKSKTPQQSKEFQLQHAVQPQNKFSENGKGVLQTWKPDSPDAIKKGETGGTLQFVRNDRERFEIQDLLKASAEVLGSGTFGSSYKAIVLGGPAMVVKRFREMNKGGKDEFFEHMKSLGKSSHRNLLPLVAFYYKKDEKLLVTDFIENGSLANHLHAKRAPGQPGLDWPTRLRILKGVAKGLAYLYEEFPNLTLYHGHLKSSNVLLDHIFEPLLTDYALVPVVTKSHAQQVMAAYKSPEFIQHNRTSRKTDVWSLGILILEVLTGKYPENYVSPSRSASADLATWVNSVIREEWTGEVFDKDMKGTRNGEGEMLKLLKIGMCCCESNLERRWDLQKAIDKIEELKEKDSDTDDFSYYSYASEGEMYTSRAHTEDDFSFSVTASHIE